MKKDDKKETENCYLEYVEGYLVCTYNHKAGEKCLMDYKEIVEDIDKS